MSATPVNQDRIHADLIAVAARLLPPDRVRALEPQLAERARYLWMVANATVGDDDAPGWRLHEAAEPKAGGDDARQKHR
jgi:predicted component of type VI protein secretion system